ncbi:MAG TPA: flagellar FlbD family protein [Candidatus Rifleibacterium sp.]|nr:flagellar FlbD family protein [Candidatus Rifleibacterium sp.]HPT47503.1 flagellar FlbD family protein [Candidatus Rifleibacterium sp.]
MIKLSRINGSPFYLNAELIEQIESTPDTVITLIGGKTVMVGESLQLVLKKIMRYRQRLRMLDRVSPKKSGKENC